MDSKNKTPKVKKQAKNSPRKSAKNPVGSKKLKSSEGVVEIVQSEPNVQKKAKNSRKKSTEYPVDSEKSKSSDGVVENVQLEVRTPIIPRDIADMRRTGKICDDFSLSCRRRCVLENISDTWKMICNNWTKENKVDDAPASLNQVWSLYMCKNFETIQKHKEFDAEDEKEWTNFQLDMRFAFWTFLQGDIDIPVRDLLHKLMKSIMYIYEMWFGGDVLDSEEQLYIHLHYMKMEVEVLMEKDNQPYNNMGNLENMGYSFQPSTSTDSLSKLS